MIRISTLYSFVSVQLIICAFLAILVLIAIIMIPIYLKRIEKDLASIKNDMHEMSQAQITLASELTTLINNRKGGFNKRV